MKNFFFLIFFCGISLLVKGQEMFELGFPVAGDSVYYMHDKLPDRVSPQYGPMTESWDLRSLQSPFAQLYIFKDPEYGQFIASFEEADLVLIEPDKTERYFRIGEKNLVELGFAGPDPNFSMLTRVVKYDRKPVAFRSFIQQRDHETSDSFTYEVSYPIDKLPHSIQNQLPSKANELVIKTKIDRYWLHMGTGSLSLPDEVYEVLCQKREDKYHYSIYFRSNGKDLIVNKELYKPIYGKWQDKQENFYHFYQQSNPFVLSILKTDLNDNVLHAMYMPSRDREVKVQQDIFKQEILAYPNPTFGDIRFNFLNYPAGKYRIEVYNVIGKKLWSKELSVPEKGIILENLSHLRKGTYLYSIFSANGKKLMTKRLMIITP